MKQIEEKLTEAIVSHYRKTEGKWPGHVALSIDGHMSLRAACDSSSTRFDPNLPDGPERYMGVPIKVDRTLDDDEIVVEG